jgi:hypothetical protein
VERERPLEVRPRREPASGLVPVADDAEALDRHAGEAGDAERLAHDEVRLCERVVDVAVLEGAIVDGWSRGQVQHRLERVVVDGDELGSVLGDVPIAGDNDGERLAHIPRRADGGGVVRDRRFDPRRERLREARDVVAGQDAADALDRERLGGVDPDARVGKLGADDGGVPRVRDGLDVVDEPTLPAEQRLVLEPLERAADPHLLLGRDRHAESIARRDRLP